ncbi:ABC transporter permease [Dermatophilus congolensis]|uniref:Glutathione transport system permease protein gsiC n=1 Tax=Dermatophilus congolensis TaxID=1863 RepID=A0A239VI62_9MICO|nr:ABC transporter permease [Dermatophilus congolensis]MBO3128982.1 ABC transporter permease [Dermatophilus congolensis]MBO3132381.1 ABC transporter permease [Dermatophilus congolensis]MBO3133458.1 ABC transporter permease [Dermatophilus congolensis]MBO3135692.1 ABC transporter permease [Dermatophilus congolensis]MBO3137931.1 ABC transporter permease [Dermatophilus congolensis]
MGTYVLRRLLQMIPVLLGATFLIFAMVFALPGDPTVGKCGERPCSPEFVAEFRAQHNLDDPLIIQYAKWGGNVLQGDFGKNYFGNPISEELTERYSVTGQLAIVAVAVEILIGVLAGILAGIRKGGFIDALVMVGTLFVISIPIIVIAPIMQLVFGIQLQWFPVTVGYDPGWYQLLLPGFVLGSLSIAYVARLTRTNLVENLRADYARTARAKGLTQKRVVGIHVLRNSLIPVITFIGADFGALLGGAIVTERIFNIPGVGGYIFEGIANRDGIAVVSAVTMLVLVFLLVNLIVDLLYGVLDPRISHD